jgi:hypothetical protein
MTTTYNETTAAATQERVCPLVRSQCIHNTKCLFWSNQLSACSLLWQGIQLDELLMRMSALEAEITTLSNE